MRCYVLTSFIVTQKKSHAQVEKNNTPDKSRAPSELFKIFISEAEKSPPSCQVYNCSF